MSKIGKSIEMESGLVAARAGRRGRELMDRECLSGVMNVFWNKTVERAAQYHECTKN